MIIMCDQTVRDKLAVTRHIVRIGDKVDLKLSLTAPLIYQVPNFGFFDMYSKGNNEYKEVFHFLTNCPLFEKTIFEANNISKFFYVQIILPLRH